MKDSVVGRVNEALCGREWGGLMKDSVVGRVNEGLCGGEMGGLDQLINQCIVNIVNMKRGTREEPYSVGPLDQIMFKNRANSGNLWS